MPRPTIALLNETTSGWTDEQAAAFRHAVQTQIDNDLEPIWEAGGNVVAVPKGQTPPVGAWWLAFLDNADQAGALGYHETTAQGLPLGKVFVGTTLQYGEVVSVTASHELLEMLVDPFIDSLIDQPTSNTQRILYAREICDACEDDQFAYIVDGVPMSDFVYPEWFHPTAPAGSRFDHGRHIMQPLQLLPGGYIGVYQPGSGWTQLTGDIVHHRQYLIPEGTRRARRQLPRNLWRRSSAFAYQGNGDQQPEV